MDACEVVNAVVLEGLGADGTPTARLRELAEAWLDLTRHQEGGKLVCLEKDGALCLAAAHTPKQARAFADKGEVPGDHASICAAAGAILLRLKQPNLLRALRQSLLPPFRERLQLNPSGTRFRQVDERLVLEPSGLLGFDPGPETMDVVARFHAYLCHAAQIEAPVTPADSESKPLASLAERVNAIRGDLRRQSSSDDLRAPRTPERDEEGPQSPRRKVG